MGEDDLFISGDWSVLIKGGEAIQLLVIILLSLSLGEVTFDTEPKKQTNKKLDLFKKETHPYLKQEPNRLHQLLYPMLIVLSYL